MILELWLTLLIIAFVLIIIGLWKDGAVLYLVGIVFLFVLSFPLLNGTLEYKTGEIVTRLGDTHSVDYEYEPYGNHTLGFIMVIMSIAMFVLFWMDWRWSRL